jgi:hypothetical protein
MHERGSRDNGLSAAFHHLLGYDSSERPTHQKPSSSRAEQLISRYSPKEVDKISIKIRISILIAPSQIRQKVR